MKDSGYDSTAAVIHNRAAGYAPGTKGLVNAGFVHMSIPFSAGALYSTTDDLLRWERGLFGGKVLSDASLRKMTTAFKNDYALGLIVSVVNGHKVISHSGGIEGFNTYLAYYPDDKVTVVVLANVNGPAPDAMGPTLGAMVLGDPVRLTSERKEIAVPGQLLAQYAGTYNLAPGFDLVITVDNGQLMAQATGQQKFPLFAESETSFFLKAVDAQVDFAKDTAGAVTALTLHQGGRDAKAMRK
jgi:CubicO group peptidase (beta-lactamase class C family)